MSQSLKPLLTAEQHKISEDASKQLFRYERAIEEHGAFIREDPERYAAWYQKHSAMTPAMGILTQSGDLNQLLHDNETSLKKECATFDDHVEAMNSAMSLTQALTMRISDIDHNVLLETLRLKTELEKQNPHKADTQNMFALQADNIDFGPAAPPNLSHMGFNAMAPHAYDDDSIFSSNQWPIAIPTSKRLSWDYVEQYPRAQVTDAEIAQYKADPDSIVDKIFIAVFEEEGDERQAFQVTSVLTWHTKEKVFYLLRTDDNEGIGYDNGYFFDLLVGAERIVVT